MAVPIVFVVRKVTGYYLTMMLRLVLGRCFVDVMLGSRLIMFIKTWAAPNAS